MFAAHARIGDGKNNKKFVLISDALTHNEESVYAFMTYIFLVSLSYLKRSTSSVMEMVPSSNRNTYSQILCMGTGI